MKEFFKQMGYFLAKSAIFWLVMSVAILALVSFLRGEKEKIGAPVRVEKLNKKYDRMQLAVQKHLLDEDDYEKAVEKLAEADKTRQNLKRIFVIDFRGDIAATAVKGLREEISAILSVAGPDDEVVLRLENYGGAVNTHGLAASQLQRIRDRNIRLTVAVDKAAASGGYMMACVGDSIIAAPFALVGSIGVIYSMPNFHRLLEEHGIDYEQHTAGKYKRTVTMFGEVTEDKREKLRNQLAVIHDQFKEHVAIHRPEIDIEKVATGEYWFGQRALALHLVDELRTSDDYLLSRRDTHEIYKISYNPPKSLAERLSSTVRMMIQEVIFSVRDGGEGAVFF